jgi:hypothetical protein
MLPHNLGVIPSTERSEKSRDSYGRKQSPTCVVTGDHTAIFLQL